MAALFIWRNALECCFDLAVPQSSFARPEEKGTASFLRTCKDLMRGSPRGDPFVGIRGSGG
jgi:hypothetical protein